MSKLNDFFLSLESGAKSKSIASSSAIDIDFQEVTKSFPMSSSIFHVKQRRWWNLITITKLELYRYTIQAFDNLHLVDNPWASLQQNFCWSFFNSNSWMLCKIDSVFYGLSSSTISILQDQLNMQDVIEVR